MDDKEPFDLDSPAAIRAMNIRQARLGALAQEVALAALTELQKKMERGEPLNLTAGEAMDLLAVGLRMERDAQPKEGQPPHKAEPPKRVH